METIRAINSMANAEAAGMDGSRSPGAVALRKRSENIHIAVNMALNLCSANKLNPEEDRATQHRLATAVDRQIAGGAKDTLDTVATTRNIMCDVMMQEAAARQLRAQGHKDPLDHLASFSSDRTNLKAAAILNRHGIISGFALGAASKGDLSAIGSGRFDQIQNVHTRFALGLMLGLNEKQLATPTMNAPEQGQGQPAPNYRNYPATGLGVGPRSAQPPAFGRKVSAER